MGEDQAAGTGPFDTEGGAEWAADLRESGNLALLIEEALGQATEEREWVEAYDGERALAAAEVVAAMRDGDRAGLPPDLLPALEDTASPAPEVIEMAREAVDRVGAARSGLAESWAGAEGGSAWRAGLVRLRGRLAP